jgi:glycosyltransferase involved in cell wall biosynthesis
MHIMQIVSGMGVNGAVLHCMHLACELAKRGHQVTLLCRQGSWSSQQQLPDGGRIVCCDLRRWPLDDLTQATKLVHRDHIDVLHTHQSRASFFGILLHWMARIPCVSTAHSRHLQPYWRFNDFVIANSEATYRFHRRWNLVPRRRIEVVHYVLDLERFTNVPASAREQLRQEWKIDGHSPVAAIIGDVIPRKAHLCAVRAWREVTVAIPDSRLLFVGEEKDARYVKLVKAEAKKLGVENKILWTGYRRDIPAVMQALDVCLSAAREESFGLTIPEAMAAGRAVVATNVGGVPENLRHGETGLLVPPGNPAALAQALIQALADTEWRKACGQRARRQVLEQYDGRRQLQQIETIYEQVTGKPAKRLQAA